jgi:o-succinylbenzoate---CoA ligase
VNGVGPLAAALAAQAAAPALRWPGGAWTYRELDRRAGELARCLAGLGVRAGDAVALAAPASPDYLALLLALPRLGALACPVNPRWPTALLGQALVSAGVTRIVSPTDPELGPAGVQWHLWPGADRQERGAPIPEGEWPDDQLVTLIFTSGSSGPPKAACHTWGNHRHSALGSAANLPLGPGDGWLMSLPLYHVGGLAILWRACLGGATMLLPTDTRDLPGALAVLDPSHVSLVPTQLHRLLATDAGMAALARMRALLLGGAPAPDSLLDLAAQRGLPILLSYGLTEMSSQVCTTAPGAGREAWRSAGRLLPHRELQVADDGELLLRGATLFQGYRRTETRFIARYADGWFHSGDLGRVDDLRQLHLLGRCDRMFISGGENLHPEAIAASMASSKRWSSPGMIVNLATVP